MRAIRAVVLASVLAAGAARADDAPDCKLHLIASLPMTPHETMIMVPATLGARQTSMLVDTGGYFSMVGAHVVKELDAETHPLATDAFTLVNGSHLTTAAHIRPFALGQMTTHEFKFLVLPDGVVGPSDMDGTIAPDIIANFDVDFDFANDKMNLISQDHCPGKVVYWAKDWAEIPFRAPDNLHIELEMTLDGKPMQATLDTGSSSSFISAGTLKKMFGADANSPGAKPLEKHADEASLRNDTQDNRSFAYTFNTLSAGGLSVSHPTFEVLPDDKASSLNHWGQMLLGMPEIRKFHMYIAYKEHVLYVTPVVAH
ncbi:MAG TPA: retropepsin-like aspartic protease [Rhizomicrobium sp.]